MMRARHEYDMLSAAIARQRADNARLRDEARRLREDPSAIEEIARRELGLIKPGEKSSSSKTFRPRSRKAPRSQHPRADNRDTRTAQAQQRTQFRLIEQWPGRERRRREKQSDGEADSRRAADDQHVAPPKMRRQVEPHGNRHSDGDAHTERFPNHDSPKHRPRAGADRPHWNTGVDQAKQKQDGCTGILNQCSNSLSVSRAVAGAGTKRPGSRAP